MIKLPNIDPHYNQGQEINRLGGFSIERLRTESILERYLPKPPANIIDVGGGAGVYSFSLASQGYDVHLVDVMALHIEQAIKINQEKTNPLKSIKVGDARELDFPSNSADTVLCLGPLYHLIENVDRRRALEEAKRVLKPGGIFIAAFISKYASLIDGVRCNFLSDPVFREIVLGDLSAGIHLNKTNNPHYFTEAYFHNPVEAKMEIENTGFRNCRLLAVEGPVWMIDTLETNLADSDIRDYLMERLQYIEEDMSVMGASSHFIALGWK